MEEQKKEITNKQFKEWFNNLTEIEKDEIEQNYYNDTDDDTSIEEIRNIYTDEGKIKKTAREWIISNYREDILKNKK